MADCPTCRRDGYDGGLDSDERAWLGGFAAGFLAAAVVMGAAIVLALFA